MANNKFPAGITSGFSPVVDAGFSLVDYQKVDLSVNNSDLTDDILGSPGKFQEYLDNYLQKKGKKVAFGGYNEQRALYRRSNLFGPNANEATERNIHLGMDIWAPQGTAVIAPISGTIHSFRDNMNFGDYGPTIILEHSFSGQQFYSLYGHLSRSSLLELKVGKRIEKGQQIAELGGPEENGNYAPHLHFQIIRDLQGNEGDYPGVASRLDIDFYLTNCPDPNLLLNIS